MAVAGFASMNVMLMAVSVWAGNVSDITPETRDLFHWMQALIALPAAAYAGRPFYESAFRGAARRPHQHGLPDHPRDRPLADHVGGRGRVRSAARLLRSAVMLLFFLLIGRTLDQTMRRRTRTLAENLSALRSETAAKIFPDGSVREAPLRPSPPAIGCWCAQANGSPSTGSWSRARPKSTGASSPARPPSCRSGRGRVHAGALNTSGALTVRVTAAGAGTLLDEIETLMAQALETKSKALLLADKATRLYVPVVHAAAALTAPGWLLAGAGCTRPRSTPSRC